jgi:hypothetical protein
MKNIKLFENFDSEPRDPEEKYYSDAARYQERHADADRDYEEGNSEDDQEGDLDEAADPLLVTSKDTMRIQDIMRKSAGNMWKAKQLAETMCKLIQDKWKAIRRARAADKEGQSELADIFFRRAADLGF